MMNTLSRNQIKAITQFMTKINEIKRSIKEKEKDMKTTFSFLIIVTYEMFVFLFVLHVISCVGLHAFDSHGAM